MEEKISFDVCRVFFDYFPFRLCLCAVWTSPSTDMRPKERTKGSSWDPWWRWLKIFCASSLSGGGIMSKSRIADSVSSGIFRTQCVKSSSVMWPCQYKTIYKHCPLFNEFVYNDDAKSKYLDNDSTSSLIHHWCNWHMMCICKDPAYDDDAKSKYLDNESTSSLIHHWCNWHMMCICKDPAYDESG